MRRTLLVSALLLTASVLLTGCDALGIETAAQVADKKEAEGKAIGSACRHAVRSVEDCFRSNPKAGKAAVFAGWKEMDAYMRENEIVGMPFTPPPPEPAAEAGAEAGAEDKTHEPTAKKTHKS